MDRYRKLTAGAFLEWTLPAAPAAARMNQVELEVRTIGRNAGIRAMTSLIGLWKDERGQDVVEYALLTAFVALSACAVFLGFGSSTMGIWSQTSTNLASANTAAS
jgi:Flp pilus assembly pilin Flp